MNLGATRCPRRDSERILLLEKVATLLNFRGVKVITFCTFESVQIGSPVKSGVTCRRHITPHWYDVSPTCHPTLPVMETKPGEVMISKIVQARYIGLAGVMGVNTESFGAFWQRWL